LHRAPCPAAIAAASELIACHNQGDELDTAELVRRGPVIAATGSTSRAGP
jgi:hypothetical protein